MHYIPYFQLRNSSIIYYEVPAVRPPRGNPTFSKKAYSGTMTVGASKRIHKAIDILLQKSPERIVYNTVTGKHFPFTINFITLTISCKRNIPLDEGYKKLLKPFLRKLRGGGRMSYVWKAEYQKRGQLHYHITTNQFVPWNQIKREWNKLQYRGGYLKDFAEKYRHYNPNSTDVHAVYKIKDIGAYLSKYMGKAVADQAKAKKRKCNVMSKGKVWDCSKDLKGNRFSFIPSYENFDILNSLVDQKKARKIELERCVIFKVSNPQVVLTGNEIQNYKQWAS